MLRMLAIAVLKDLQALIRSDIFRLSGEARRKKIDEVLGKKYPNVFRAYFSTVDSGDLHKDSARLLKFVSTGRFTTTDFALFTVLQRFIVKELPSLDGIDDHGSMLLTAVKTFQDRGERVIEQEILRFAERFPGVLPIRVQTALPLSTSDKKQIRDHFNKENGLCHIIFSTDSSLLGGIRVFKNGALFDASFAHKIGLSTRLP